MTVLAVRYLCLNINLTFVSFFAVFAGSLPISRHALSYGILIWFGDVWILLISLLSRANKSNHERVLQTFFPWKTSHKVISPDKNDEATE